ncbi:MAG TPA: pyridoxine 5'-phosphate synthase, partial [Vicinamibacterales bacterium]
IEGDPRPDFVELVAEVRPDQCTLVPVRQGEITSPAGWLPETRSEALRVAVDRCRSLGIRVSLFVDPDDEAIGWAGSMGAHRVELYTEPFARAFEAGEGPAAASFDAYARTSRLAASLGLGVNAGHDLDLRNLTVFRRLPHLAEVSIGHALISHALYVGLDRSVRDYLQALADPVRSPTQT